MANRALLYLNRSGDPNDRYREEDVLVAASYFIPILWCSLFTPADIVWCDVRFEPGDLEEGVEYEMTFPSLLTPLANARARAMSHRSYFFQLFPEHLSFTYYQWLTLLNEEDAPAIQIATQDLWAMDGDTPKFLAKLHAFTRAFEERSLVDLQELLGEVEIRLDRAHTKALFDEADIRYRLRGARWSRPVPWHDD